MRTNPITEFESETPYLDEKDWQIALGPYAENPHAALTLGIHLVELKRRIKDLNMQEAIEGIEVAIDCLYNHSDFHSIGRGLFESAIEGKLTTDKESLLRQLGVEVKDDEDD
jgi:hypothetical protein